GLGDLGSAVERLGLGHGEKNPQFGPELSAQKVLVVERAPVECLLFHVECIHGFLQSGRGVNRLQLNRVLRSESTPAQTVRAACVSSLEQRQNDIPLLRQREGSS